MYGFERSEKGMKFIMKNDREKVVVRTSVISILSNIITFGKI